MVHGPQSLRNSSLAARLFTWDFGNVDAFLKGRLISLQTKGLSGSPAGRGPGSLLCLELGHLLHPGSLLPPRPCAEAPYTAQDRQTASQPRKTDRALRARLLRGNRKAQAPARGRSSRVSREEAVRALGVQSGEADGLSACRQPRNTECSFTVQQVHLGGEPLHSRPRWDRAFAIWKATSPPCSLRCPSGRPRRRAPLSASLHPSFLPPAAWDPRRLLPVTRARHYLLGVSLGAGQEEKGGHEALEPL